MLDVAYALIFGGCCANVFALEAIVKHEPDSGFLITVNQFVVVTLFSLPSQLHPRPSFFSTPRLAAPTLPTHRLAILALLFFSVNMLNNWAFAFDISVPMHIVLRSFGSVTTMAVGWLTGKRYSRVQVLAVLALTAGVVMSAWADAQGKGKSLSLLPSSDSSSETSSYAAGLLILLTAQLLSAVMGVYTETTYASRPGGDRAWREVLFYTHALSLVLSLAFLPELRRQLAVLRAASPPAASATPAAQGAWLPSARAGSANPLSLLALNAATQVVCIYGVNRLCAITSAVAVTVVLNVRKLASFLLSCAIFGNRVEGLGRLGAVVVFAAGGVYGWDGSRRKAKAKAEPREEERENGVAREGRRKGGKVE